MSYVVLDSHDGRIWQFEQLEDAVSKLGEITTVSDALRFIQSQLELWGRYSIVHNEYWVEIFRRNP